MLTLEKGDAIIRKGAKLDHIYLIVDGSTQAHIMGRHLTAQSSSAGAKIKMGGDSGAWVGEMTFLDHLAEKERRKNAPAKTEEKQAEDGASDPSTNSKNVSRGNQDAVKSAVAAAKKIDVPGAAASKTACVLYTVLVKEKCTVLRWSFEDMEALMLSSIVRLHFTSY